MALKVCELISIVLSTLVTGMFFGPWVALTVSMKFFPPDTFLAIVHRLNRNMAAVMTLLMPAALFSILPVLFLARPGHTKVFYLNLAGLGLFLVALIVTMTVEVPIVKQFGTFTVATLPDNWQQMRHRWGAFHIVRVVVSMSGLVLLLAAAIF